MTLGLHIQADSGRSEEELYQLAIASKGRTHTVLNGPGLASRLLQAGKRVIYRRWRSEIRRGTLMNQGDNNADEWYDPVDFVNRIHAEAPNGAILALGNEMWCNTPDTMRRMNDWTVRALVRCNELGRKAGIFSISVWNPDPALWQYARPALELAKASGHLLLLHEYWGRNRDTNALSTVNSPELIKRYTLIPASLPRPEIVITELGLAYGMPDPSAAGRGFVGIMSDDAYAAELIKVQKEYAKDGIDSCIFVLTNKGNPHWDSFNVNDKVVAKIAAYNVTEAVTITPVVPPVNSVVKTVRDGYRVNVRKEPNTGSDAVDMLNGPVNVQIVETTNAKDAQGYLWNKRAQGGWIREDMFTDYVAPVMVVPFKILRPLKRYVRTDAFGAYRDYSAIAPGKLPEHEGDDFATVPAGDTNADVLMGRDGVVEATGYSPNGYGNWARVRFDAGDGKYGMWYGHLSRIDVRKDQRLKAGDVIGKAGTTGNSSGVHVHATLTHPTLGLDNYVIDKVVNPNAFWTDNITDVQTVPPVDVPLMGHITVDEVRQLANLFATLSTAATTIQKIYKDIELRMSDV